MNPYTEEDVLWPRLKDMQREAENRRLIRAEAGISVRELLRMLAARAWLLAGLAMRRPPRKTWPPHSAEANAGGDRDAVSRVA